MKRNFVWALVTFVVLAGASLKYTQNASSSSFNQPAAAEALAFDGIETRETLPDCEARDGGALSPLAPCVLTCPTDITVPNDPDACGAVVTYTEPSGPAADCGVVTCDHPSGSRFPVGTTTVTCKSPVDSTASCSFKVTVNDTQAPEIIAVARPVMVWPPNHKYVTFEVADLVRAASDNCDRTVDIDSVIIPRVTSDEPENEGGDGNTRDDIVIASDCKSVQLRAERMGDGNGRVYTLTFIATDMAGNVGTAMAKVVVPHSQDGAAAIDDGPQFRVLSQCPRPANVMVRLHYLDFLNREPDQDGFNFWAGQINKCTPRPNCAELSRIGVSASFFLSIEGQQSGYLVERFYKVAYGDATGTSSFNGRHQLAVPIVRLGEFLKDTQRISQDVVVLRTDWERQLENNKQDYAGEFVQTTRFMNAFPDTLTPTEFVDKLNRNAGDVLSTLERVTAINLFGGANDISNATARAQAVRQVAEDPDLYRAEFNRAFVLTEYFGYLRRNPNEQTDADYTGFDFWLTKLNQFKGNYLEAEMVKAFLSSVEYQQRFGQ
jgi:HYR domain